MTKVILNKKYITCRGDIVECTAITGNHLHFKNEFGGIMTISRLWAEQKWKSVEPQRLPVVGELWVRIVNKLPYKILDIDDEHVCARHKNILCGYTIEVFLRNWSPPRHAPEEIYVNVYENIEQEPYTASFFTKEKAENFQAATHFTIKETAVRYIRADTVSQ